MPSQVDYSATERGVSRSGTRHGQPNAVLSSDLGLTRVSGQNLDAFMERCDGSHAVTQKLLGELISRPKLTEKLLERPPFRFLHDIITEVIKVTGFAVGLYTSDELDSAKVTEKQQKVNFLDKAIKLVGTQLNTLVEAKALKIVAGLDPQVTNVFLQLLAVAAKHSPQSKGAVQLVLSGDSDAINTRADSKEKVRGALQAEKKPSRDDKPVSLMAAELKVAEQPSLAPAPEVKRSARPSTAGRRPPRPKANAAPEGDAATAESKPLGIIIDGQQDDEEIRDRDPLEESRLAEELRGIATVLDDSAAQSKLVQDILTRQAEHESANQVRNNVTFFISNKTHFILYMKTGF